MEKPLTSSTGSLVEVDYLVKPLSPAGVTALDLQSVQLNEGALVLTVEPVVGSDVTDGSLTIQTVSQAPSLRVEPKPVTDKRDFYFPLPNPERSEMSLLDFFDSDTEDPFLRRGTGNSRYKQNRREASAPGLLRGSLTFRSL